MQNTNTNTNDNKTNASEPKEWFCNKCGQLGYDDDLKLIPDGSEFYKGCPHCETDAHLMYPDEVDNIPDIVEQINNDKQSQANARLIACALEMLAMLEEFIESDMCQRQEDEGMECPMITKAKQLISRAKGQGNE